MKPRVAIIVLNYNTKDMTDRLADYLHRVLAYPNKTLFIVDNGSAECPRSTTHKLDSNVGFTNGFAKAIELVKNDGQFDGFWLLNSDVGFEYGNLVLDEMVSVAFSRSDVAQIAPQHNSPHDFMVNAPSAATEVPFLEPTATLIKTRTIDAIGFWDLELTLGWGVDYDYGFRVRAAGLVSLVTNRARITHKEHKSILNFSEYMHRAAAEMNSILANKYGPHWYSRIR